VLRQKKRGTEPGMIVHNPTVMKSILTDARTIAVVGASPKPWRDSHNIAEYLANIGYTVIPVNPNYDEIDGRRCYATLRDVPEPIDIVNVFRNPVYVLPIIDDAIAMNANTIWLQLGVVNDEAIRHAHEAGVNVVVDECILVQHRLLFAQ
jgi:predicted CoA-binding protein